jgi:hypothetical protein
MPVITNLEDKILNLIKQNQYQWFTVGVNLGGTAGENGGSGITLGGFTGQLIQSKIAYDTTEAESLFIPISGQSLVHNLNRIRYRVNILEALAGGQLVVEDEGIIVASGVNYLNFTGGATVTSPSPDRVNIFISGGGGGAGTFDGITIIFEDVTNQIPPANNFYILSQPVYSGSLQVHVNGLLQKPVNYTPATSGFTYSETLTTNDEVIAQYLTVTSGIGLTVLDDGAIVGTDIKELDFLGAYVTVSGIRATISGVGGGGGGASSLDELGDVVITGPIADSEVLAYDTGTSKWINQTAAETNLSVIGHIHTESDITDLSHDAVKIQGINVVGWPPTISGQVLVFDGNVYAPGTVSGGGGVDTKQVKVSSNDTTENYLENKIVSGSNITITVVNDGANEQLVISGGAGVGTDLKPLVRTAISTVTDAHSTNSTWEDVKGMLVTFSGLTVSGYTAVCTYTCHWRITSANWEGAAWRFVVSGSQPGGTQLTIGELYHQSKDTNPVNNAQYITTIHSTFSIPSGNIIIKTQWGDQTSQANIDIFNKRITVIAFPPE